MRRGACVCAAVALACAAGALGSPAFSRDPSHAAIARARCPRGHVLLALRGPHLVRAQPEAYVVLARACARAPRLLHFSVAGPQKISWLVRRGRARSTVKRRIELKFPPLVNASSTPFAIITLEARSRTGKLVGRLRVKVVYLEAPPREQPPPGGLTVGWGVNFRGQLGAGYRSQPLTRPVHGLLSGVRQIAVGDNAGFALLEDGTVRAWGENLCGQLGDGTRAERLNPVRVTGLSHVIQIAAAGNHVLALLENGTVFAWGANFWGTLGNGTRDTVEGTAHPMPQQVPGLSGVIGVAAGGGDDAAILANGTVVAWGENKNGQLGDGSTKTKLVPTPVRGLVGVKSVAIGGISSLGSHTLAVLGDGHVMGVGANGHGQLGLGDTNERLLPAVLPGLSNVASVSASDSHTLALLTDGTVLSWGLDANGELGYPAPQMCGTQPCATSPHPAPVGKASAIAAGERFSVSVSEGHVRAWGMNELGQLGNGATAQSVAAVEVPAVTGITALAASEKFTLALAEQGPSPDFSLRSGPGFLIAEWTPVAGAEPWGVSWRVAAHPPLAWGKPAVVPASAHSYAITGLSRTRYEVKLIRLNEPAFGRRIAYGVPE